MKFLPWIASNWHMSTDASTPPKAKKPRMSALKIGTHNGTFHCDDVLAVWMLHQTQQFKGAQIIRSRTPEVLNACDIVVDVGAVFDHSKLRYDHHQRDFKETYNSINPSKSWTTKLSSAGLVYAHYGSEVIKTVIQQVTKCAGGDASNISDEEVDLISDKVYDNLIEELDAVDNGISATEEIPKYKVTTTLSSRVATFNPRWNEESNEDVLLDRFKDAMIIVAEEFVERVKYYKLAWLPAHSLVKDSVMKR